jgi:hypothetical protein
MNGTTRSPLRETTQYGPLTKSIDIGEALMLVALSREYEGVDAWREEALFRLPQASRKRRREIVRAVERKFLEPDGDRFVDTPLRELLTMSNLDDRTKRDLLFAQYLRTTPLVWEAVEAVVLPKAEAGARPLAVPEDGEIVIDDWMSFLDGRLNTTTTSTVVKTRNHITAHLHKFGVLDMQPVPGDRLARHFFAHHYDPDPRAFWFSLALESVEQGWTTRSLDHIVEGSWTRVAYCSKTTYARYAIEEAERAALVLTSFFGSDKQITLRGPDPVANVVGAIRHG